MIIKPFDKINLVNHELIQQYINYLYKTVNIDNCRCNNANYNPNEIYGELYYYSMLELLKYLNITQEDHFLDLGSGFGKIVFQVFLITPATSVTGIEINHPRSLVANKIKRLIYQQLPDLFNQKNNSLHVDRFISLIHGDFLTHNIDCFNHITIIYLCCTVFSMELLDQIQNKILNMPNVQKIIAFKQLPKLTTFNLKKKFFLHGDWDYTTCYLYTKNITNQHHNHNYPNKTMVFNNNE